MYDTETYEVRRSVYNSYMMKQQIQYYIITTTMDYDSKIIISVEFWHRKFRPFIADKNVGERETTKKVSVTVLIGKYMIDSAEEIYRNQHFGSMPPPHSPQLA